ncbi:MAG: hypothetical protein ABL877_00455 [Thiobacillus sp.]
MKTIGHRQPPPLSSRASGDQLAIGIRFSETLSHFSPALGIAKGVYRYSSHEAANQHWLECVARNMARQYDPKNRS